MKKSLAILAFIFCANSANAADAPAWKIVSDQSKLEFKVSQDSSAINGYFRKFGGTINFDKNQLAQSKVAIDIDTSSITTSTTEASGSVQTPEWLSTKAFPKATFFANKFTLASDNKTFRATGTLKIKDRVVPTSLDFTFTEYSALRAIATGKVILKRSAFGIGNADVKKANGVSDNVEVTFTVIAAK